MSGIFRPGKASEEAPEEAYMDVRRTRGRRGAAARAEKTLMNQSAWGMRSRRAWRILSIVKGFSITARTPSVRASSITALRVLP